MKDLRDVNPGPDQVALPLMVLGLMPVYRWQHLVPASVCISGEVCVNPKLDALTFYTLEEAARNNYDIYVLRWVGVVAK